MSFSKKINQYRRNTTRFLTGKMGSGRKARNIKPINRQDIKRVLICRPNHRLGNQLLITPLIQEASNQFPGCRIDLFLKGSFGPVLFKNYPEIDRFILLPKKHFKQLFLYIKCWFLLKNRKYDLVINVDSGSSSGRLSTKFARAKHKIFQENEETLSKQYFDFKHFAKAAIYELRYYLNTAGIASENREIPLMDIRLDAGEIVQGRKILAGITQNDKKTIGIYTYATGTKCYTKEQWLPFYEELKTRYESRYNIVEILPVENVSQIDFKAAHFYSRDIREIAAVMHNMEVFISADCGMMHLASASPVPTVGLFIFGNAPKYEPYGNGSRAINLKTLDAGRILKEVDDLLS